MEETINERLRRYISSKKMSINAFSKEIGVLQATLNAQVNGTYAVSTQTLAGIAARFPEINFHWLLTGKGDMEIKSEVQSGTKENDSATSNVEASTLLNIIEKLQDENANLIKILSDK